MSTQYEKERAERLRIDMAANGYLTMEETRFWTIERLLREEKKFDDWLDWMEQC